jgi:hypothetical protein
MNIYDKRDQAFKDVSASVITDQAGNRKATVSIKYPKDGAGRLTMFVHVIGTEIVCGTASGYGYDKAGAAFENACTKFKEEDIKTDGLIMALNRVRLGGIDWEDKVRELGLNVLHAI